MRVTYGKKFVTVPAATIPNSMNIKTYVLISVNASLAP